MSVKLMTIPLSKLQQSPDNVRKTYSPTDLEELVASIDALGVLQNLTVMPAALQQGKPKDRYEVVMGGRRLAALHVLLDRKRIRANYPVPCIVRSEGASTEISLAENVIRAPLHPADQFEAFSKLHAEGMGIEDIGARFGIPAKVVQQRLKLAAVSPRLMQVYREGGMTLDQLIAFTITDDHGAQESVWSAGSANVDPHSIRRALTRSLVEGRDRRARFVGAEAYEAAGGVMVRDLFRTDDEAYFADSQLLDRLVGERLTAEAEKLKAQGWAWVEILGELDYGHLATFRRLTPTEIPLSPEEEAAVSELSNRYDELVESLDDDVTPEQEAEVDRLGTELEMIGSRKEQWTEEQKAASGTIVCLDYHGNLNVVVGLAKPEAEPEGEQETSAATSRSNGSGGTRSRSGNSLPERLVEDLSAHRTAALRETLAGQPSVALTGLLYVLALRTFFGYTGASCIDVLPRPIDLRGSADGIAESKAAAAFAARHERWLQSMPERGGLWEWLTKQDDTTRADLLAYCVATAINAVCKRYDIGVEERLEQAQMLATAVHLDMADWWEPTKERYLSWVSKSLIVAAVGEAVSKAAADNIAEMKKEPMVVRAEELLAGRRWLPDPLRQKAPEQPA